MYTFRGRLCGLICPECPEPLSSVKIRLYRLRENQDPAALAVSNPKDTFAVLNEEEIKAKAGSLLAEVETDEEGRFTVELGDRQDYRGEAFEVDLYCGTVPRQKLPRVPPRPHQLSLTTVQPQWRQREAALAVWEYCIPHRVWCHFRGLFGAWTVCGQVLVCDQKVPVAGVKVTAFDADWIQDDQIGSAVTDGSGKFRIDYLAEDFSKTPFSPLINLELTAGPDLYFRIETLGGIALLSEPSSRGRKPDRENVGHCFCVDLCVSQPPDTGVNPIPLFTHVGQYHVDPIYGDFTADGLTAAGSLAFTDTIPLRGLLPNGSAPDALEYHFRAGEYDAAGTVLGPVSDIDQTMIAPTVIGQLEYFDWDTVLSAFVLRSADYWVNHPGAPTTTIHRNGLPDISVQLNQPVQPGGWIAVPRQNQLVPNGQGLFVGGFVDMVDLDTTRLTKEVFDLTAPPPELHAGDSVPAGQRSRMHRFKLFFEARKAGTAPILSAINREKIVLSNTWYTQDHHPTWAGFVDQRRAVVLVDIAELAMPGSGCNKISNHVHALYTAYHPFLGSVSVYFEGNTPPPLPATIAPAIAGGEAVSPPGGYDFDFTPQKNCAYILWLQVSLNLTQGYGPFLGDLYDHVAFCKG